MTADCDRSRRILLHIVQDALREYADASCRITTLNRIRYAAFYKGHASAEPRAAQLYSYCTGRSPGEVLSTWSPCDSIRPCIRDNILHGRLFLKEDSVLYRSRMNSRNTTVILEEGARVYNVDFIGDGVIIVRRNATLVDCTMQVQGVVDIGEGATLCATNVLCSRLGSSAKDYVGIGPGSLYVRARIEPSRDATDPLWYRTGRDSLVFGVAHIVSRLSAGDSLCDYNVKESASWPMERLSESKAATLVSGRFTVGNNVKILHNDDKVTLMTRRQGFVGSRTQIVSVGGNVALVGTPCEIGDGVFIASNVRSEIRNRKPCERASRSALRIGNGAILLGDVFRTSIHAERLLPKEIGYLAGE